MNFLGNITTSAQEKVNCAIKSVKNSGKGVNNAVAAGFAAVSLMTGMASCEKSADTGNFDHAASAGALATLSCADTASIPVDAHGIITVTRLTNDKLIILNRASYVNHGQPRTIDPGTTNMTCH